MEVPIPTPPDAPLADPSAPFTAMAARVAKNSSEFGGALLVVAPDGTVLAELSVNPSPDLTEFWTTTKSKVEVALSEHLSREQTKANIYGARR